MTEWRPIPGWLQYEASDDGRIRRNEREASRFVDRHGYLKVGLWDGTHAKNLLVHRVVYQAFFGPLKSSQQINHIDGVKGNNRLLNLEVVSGAENVAHAHRLGLYEKGEHNSHAKLSEADVLEIRRLSALGLSRAEVAGRFGIHRWTVWRIATKARWAHVA